MSNQSFLKHKLQTWFRDFTSLANPLILLFVPLAVLKPSYNYVILIILLSINEILCSLIKIIFPKKRPDGQSYSTLLEKIDAGSFPSLHTSRITITYLSLFFLTDILLLKILYTLVIALVAYSRIQLKRHFLTDIIGGFVIGIIITLLGLQFFTI